MNAQVAALRIGGAVFGLMSIAQLAGEHACPQLDVVVGRLPTPLWPSVVAAVFLAGLCLWMWKVSYPVNRRRERG